MKQTFSVGAVLSVSTGIMLARDFGEVHRLMDHLTGDTLFTHQLPRAFKPCAAALKTQFPALSGIVPPPNVGAVLDEWILEQTKSIGAAFDVEPMPAGAWRAMDPIAELHMLRSGGATQDAN